MSKVAFDFGIIQVYWYSICILFGMIVGMFFVLKEAKRKYYNIDVMTDIIFYTVIWGVIGARLYYVLFNLNEYSQNFLEVFEIWNGGLAIHGGIITGLVVILIYCKKKNINTLKMLDIGVVGVIIAQAIGRWGNFFNGEAYGPVTTMAHLKSLLIPNFIIKGMYIDGAYHIPTFLYESIWCFLGFIIMILLRKYKKLRLGTLTGFYLIWYGIERFFVEILRTDSLMLFNIKVAQIVSIIFIISGIIIIIKNKEEYNKVKLKINRK
jgi:phosphatidylglycerol:prolipoprotein diacylglycerol transferase